MTFLRKHARILFGTLLTSIILAAGAVYAAQYYQIGSGVTLQVDEWDECRNVTNNNGDAIFVPTNSSAEWDAFRTNAQNVLVESCPENLPLTWKLQSETTINGNTACYYEQECSDTAGFANIYRSGESCSTAGAQVTCYFTDSGSGCSGGKVKGTYRIRYIYQCSQ